MIARVVLGLLLAVVTVGDVAAQQPAVARVQPTLAPLPTGADLVIQATGARQLPAPQVATDGSAIQQIVAKLKRGDSAGANADWRTLVGAIARRHDQTDIQAVILHVVHGACLQDARELREAAGKVRRVTDTRNTLRQHLSEVRQQAARAGRQPRFPVPHLDLRQVTGDHTPPVQQVTMTAAEVDAYVKTLQDKLDSVGDDSQLANVDLQDAMQKQQQLVQMISNVAKMLYDTAMAVVRKIGG